MSTTLVSRIIVFQNANSEFNESDIFQDSGILAAVELAGQKTVQNWYGSYAVENAGVYTSRQALYLELISTAANDATILAGIPALVTRMAALANPYNVFTWSTSISYGP